MIRLTPGSIKTLKLVRQEISELQEYERSISSTLVPQSISIEDVYKNYLDVARERGVDMDDTMTLRKNFIFISAWLYAPGVLAGDRMPRGLRNNLMKIFGVYAPTAISNNFAETNFYFNNHSSTRSELTEMANETLRRISIG